MDMKKVERLRFIEKNFGKKYVLPYKECTNERQIIRTVKKFESDGFTWGMRTDLTDGSEQGCLMPFILRGNLDEVLRVFGKWKDKLVYIVSHNILDYVLNGVATLHDSENVFFEINPIDNVAQRHMYDNPKNLRQFFVGEWRRNFHDGLFYPGFKPEDSYPYDFGLSEVYYLLCGRTDVKEITFSVRHPDRKVVIW